MTETAFGALLIILAGWVARRYGVIRREDGPLLVRVVINLAMPPLIFLILVRADLHGSLLLVPVAAIAIHAVLLGRQLLLKFACQTVALAQHQPHQPEDGHISRHR